MIPMVWLPFIGFSLMFLLGAIGMIYLRFSGWGEDEGKRSKSIGAPERNADNLKLEREFVQR